MNYATHLNNAVPYGVHITAADPAECRRAQQSYEALLADPAAFPCSFALDGNRQTGFVGFEQVNRATAQQGDKRTDTLVLRRADGLECRVEAALYPRHAAYEWTLWFKNCGSADSPVLSSLNGADFVLPGKKPRLRSIMGDARNERYGTGDGTISPTYGMNNQPYDLPLALGMSYQMVNTGARSCDHEFPYFTLQMADRGTVIAVGWPGQWRAEFYADLTGVHFTDGQQKFAAALHPGEEIRTPMTTLLLYDGADAQRQTNLWRAFMMECNMPRQNGYISLPILSSSSYGTGMMTAATEQNQLEQIAFYRENGVMLDNWWMDAGWYTTDTDEGAPKVEDDYVFVGSWKIREKDFPTHLAAVSDAMHATGGTTLLWFEPERCGIEPDTLKTDGGIISAEVSGGGLVTVCARESGYKGSVTVFDLSGTVAYKWLSGEAYVLAARLTEDGKQLAVLTLTDSGSRVVYLDTDKDKASGETVLEGELLLDIGYDENENLCAISADAVYRLGKGKSAKVLDSFEGSTLVGYCFKGGCAYALNAFRTGGSCEVRRIQDGKPRSLGSFDESFTSLSGDSDYIAVLTAASLTICRRADGVTTGHFEDASAGLSVGLTEDGNAIVTGRNTAKVYACTVS